MALKKYIWFSEIGSLINHGDSSLHPQTSDGNLHMRQNNNNTSSSTSHAWQAHMSPSLELGASVGIKILIMFSTLLI